MAPIKSKIQYRKYLEVLFVQTEQNGRLETSQNSHIYREANKEILTHLQREGGGVKE